MAFNLINFKKGTLAGLNTLKTNNGVEEGTFYLTIDENKQTSRLYIGTGATTALPVNSNITVVSTTDDLTSSHAANFNDGDFAYVTTGNILAVRYNGVWTQINAPDSRAIKDLTPSISMNNGTATITWTLRDQNNNSILTSDNTPVMPEITMTGANGVAVSSSGRDITVTGTAYELHSPAVVADSNTASIKIQKKTTASGSLADVSSIAISAGPSGNVSITGTADNIVIDAVDSTVDTMTGSAESTGFGFVAHNTDGTSSTKGTIDPVITALNSDGTAATGVHFVNGTAALQVYTKAAVDDKFKLANAMKYRGTVGNSSATFATLAAVTNPQIGDTFKVAGDLSGVPIAGNGTGTAKVGDLLIANGTEDSSGNITSASLYYEIISIDEDTDTTYSIIDADDANGKGIAVHASTDPSGTNIGSIKLANGTLTTVSSSGTTDKVLTVNHATITTSTAAETTNPTITQSDGASQAFAVVTSLTNDGKGHITSVNTRTITVKDTNSSLTSVEDTVTAGTGADAGKKATITTTVNMASAEHGNMSQHGDVELVSDNLSITTPAVAANANPQVKVNFVWGTF